MSGHLQLTKSLSLPWFLQAEHKAVISHSTCCRLVCLYLPPAPPSFLFHTLSSMTSARQLSPVLFCPTLPDFLWWGLQVCSPSSPLSGWAQNPTFGLSSMTCLNQDINGTGTPCKTDAVLTITDGFISTQDKPELAHQWLSDQIPLRASLCPQEQASRSLYPALSEALAIQTQPCTPLRDVFVTWHEYVCR